jgi:sec-independent protein translocase protein TatB
MFDISWSEFLLIGIVALVVIGPKELPAVMRTLGKWTRKVRGMATEFQNQFQEAMREAEMADLKKEVDDLAHDVKSFDPTKDVRDDLRGLGEDFKQSLAAGPEPAPAVPAADPAPALTADPALTQTSAEAPSAPLDVVPTPAGDAPAAAATPPEAPPPQASRELETVAAQGEPAATDAADKPAQTDATGHTG